MSEHIIAVDDTEKLSCGRDDCQEIAVEKTDSEEDEDLAEASAQSNSHTFYHQGAVTN